MGFNNAVSTFSGIVENINRTRTRLRLCVESETIVKEVGKHLKDFRDIIQYKRADFPDLHSKIESYKQSIDAMEKAYLCSPPHPASGKGSSSCASRLQTWHRSASSSPQPSSWHWPASCATASTGPLGSWTRTCQSA